MLRRRLHNFRVSLLRKLPWWLSLSFDRLGIEFWYKGDTVIWTWPWRRDPANRPFISLAFTGTGEFGDARYGSLKELDQDFRLFEAAMANLATEDPENL